MSGLEKNVAALFKKIMHRCRQERKEKTNTTVRELAKKIDKTENYVSSIENGREFPSLKTFLHYLLVNNFDIEPLLKLSIKNDCSTTKSSKKFELVDKIYSLDEDQVIYLVEQAKIAEEFKFKTKKDKTK